MTSGNSGPVGGATALPVGDINASLEQARPSSNLQGKWVQSAQSVQVYCDIWVNVSKGNFDYRLQNKKGLSRFSGTDINSAVCKATSEVRLNSLLCVCCLLSIVYISVYDIHKEEVMSRVYHAPVFIGITNMDTHKSYAIFCLYALDCRHCYCSCFIIMCACSPGKPFICCPYSFICYITKWNVFSLNLYPIWRLTALSIHFCARLNSIMWMLAVD